MRKKAIMSATPATPFTYAVIIERSIQHEGDERSRTHPGHGYPAYTETVKEFKEFKDEAEFRVWVEHQESKRYGSETYRAIAFKPVEIKKSVSFDIRS